jgi:hypothetical protein
MAYFLSEPSKVIPVKGRRRGGRAPTHVRRPARFAAHGEEEVDDVTVSAVGVSWVR